MCLSGGTTHAAVPERTQFGGVPVSPLGQVPGTVTQFGGVPASPTGQVPDDVPVGVTPFEGADGRLGPNALLAVTVKV
jgi:hypothetical protein